MYGFAFGLNLRPVLLGDAEGGGGGGGEGDEAGLKVAEFKFMVPEFAVAELLLLAIDEEAEADAAEAFGYATPSPLYGKAFGYATPRPAPA